MLKLNRVIAVSLFLCLSNGSEAVTSEHIRCHNTQDVSYCSLNLPSDIYFNVKSFLACAVLCTEQAGSSLRSTDLLRMSLFSESMINASTRSFSSLMPSASPNFAFEEQKEILIFGDSSFKSSMKPPVDWNNYVNNFGCLAFNFEKHTQSCLLYDKHFELPVSTEPSLIEQAYTSYLFGPSHTSLRRNQPSSHKATTEGLSCEHYQIKALPQQSCFHGFVSCKEYGLKGVADNGVYYISTPYGLRPVYCHYSVVAGVPIVGMLIQRRINGLENFNRMWHEYEGGFGALDGEHWLGNKYISYLTNAKAYKMVVEMIAFDGTYAYAKYSSFKISSAALQYALSVDGYKGTAGHALYIHNGMKFSTPDRKNNAGDFDCASRYSCGWWFKSCFNSNLNGLMVGPGSDHIYAGAQWETFKNKNRECFMKIYL